MWWNLLKFNWHSDLTISPQLLSWSYRLCVPHIAATWILYQHIFHYGGYQLPWVSNNDIRLPWDERWKFWEFSFDGKILWKRGQFAILHSDHTEPFENKVGETFSRHKNTSKYCKFSFPRFYSNSFASGLGFYLEYESTNDSQWDYSHGACGGSFTASNGILNSPLYPEDEVDPGYGYGYWDCIYRISQPVGAVILLNFLNLDTEMDWSCVSCYLDIRDGSSGDSPLLKRLCDGEIPAPIQSSQNHLWMKWVIMTITRLQELELPSSSTNFSLISGYTMMDPNFS